jgi:hypothetical protein
MWGDPETKAICREAKGNLFVKNLDKSIEDSQLHEAFANFGEIISCKICVDKDGKSLGYGYVQFRKPDDAKQAMDDLKEASINGMPLQIQPFQRRLHKNPEETYTNIYVKNLPDSIRDEEQLMDLFRKFGTVLSAHIPKDDSGNPRGFGMCSMKEHESAVRAVEELNGSEHDGKVEAAITTPWLPCLRSFCTDGWNDSANSGSLLTICAAAIAAFFRTDDNGTLIRRCTSVTAAWHMSVVPIFPKSVRARHCTRKSGDCMSLSIVCVKRTVNSESSSRRSDAAKYPIRLKLKISLDINVKTSI